MTEDDYVAAFQQSLKNYKPSRDALTTLKDMRLTLLVGPSSSGRNAVIRELIKTGEYHYIVSDTTREPRINDGVPEVDGVEYHFRSNQDVLDDIKTGKFLEAAYVHKKHVYGISVREVHKAHDDNKIAITDVEVVGAANIQKVKPDTSIIFMIPPGFQIWLDRLHRRGVLPEEEVCRRLESAMLEFEAAIANGFYTYIINDELEEAVAKVYEVSKLGRVYPDEQKRGRAVIEQLVIETRRYLDNTA